MSRVRLAASLAVAILIARAATAQNPPFRGDDPAGAARYFVEMRVGPNGTIPSGARATALAQMRARWPQLVAQRDAACNREFMRRYARRDDDAYFHRFGEICH